jgi:hypothetical protein
MVSKCKDTFILLGLLRESDFEALDFTRLSAPPARVVGQRLSRGRQKLERLGVPQRLIFAAPTFLLIAPKLGGLLVRLSRKRVDDVPLELRDLYTHVQQHGIADVSRDSPPPFGAGSKTLFHVAKDGTRTALTSSNARHKGARAVRSTQVPQYADGACRARKPQPATSERRRGYRPIGAFQRALANDEPKKSRG